MKSLKILGAVLLFIALAPMLIVCLIAGRFGKCRWINKEMEECAELVERVRACEEEQETYLEEDGCPTGKSLGRVMNWPADDFAGLALFVTGHLWQRDYGKYGNSMCDSGKLDTLILTTGGWSGNEAIIAAMEKNVVWWMNYWAESKLGGWYLFKART